MINLRKPPPPPKDGEIELKYQGLCERLDALVDGIQALVGAAQQDHPQDYERFISDSKQIALELLGKRRLFVMTQTALTIIVNGFATPIQLSTQAFTWENITWPEGTVIQTTGQANPVAIYFRATNETVP